MGDPYASEFRRLPTIVAQEHGKVRGRWLGRDLIDHVSDVAAMVRRVIHDMQHYIAASHRPRAATDERKIDRHITGLRPQIIDVAGIPVINSRLRVA